MFKIHMSANWSILVKNLQASLISRVIEAVVVVVFVVGSV